MAAVAGTGAAATERRFAREGRFAVGEQVFVDAAPDAVPILPCDRNFQFILLSRV